jgi:hypothetical protein
MFGKNLQLYFDNFYTSVELLKDLHTRGVLACGTVRTNRKGLPKQLLAKAAICLVWIGISRHDVRIV